MIATLKLKELTAEEVHHFAFMENYRNALFEITHNLRSRVKYREEVSVEDIFEEIVKIIEEENININLLG